MTLGWFGIVLALGVAVTIPFAGAYQVEKDLAQGLGDTAISAIIGTLTAALMFLCLVAAAIFYRKKTEVHKRLMLLATITILWPAWIRFGHFFPSIPNPEIWFALVLADSLIVISWIWERSVRGKIHPTLFFVGIAIILDHSFEVIAFDSPIWRELAKQLYSLF